MNSSADSAADPEQTELSRGPKIWGFWLTLIWGLGAAAVWSLSQLAVVIVLLARMGGTERDQVTAHLRQLASNGPALALTLLISMPFLVGFLFLATRRARASFRDYLGLKWPTWRQVILGFVALVVVLGLGEVAASLLDISTPPFMTDTLRSAEESGGFSFLAFVFGFAFAAPFSEEILFRGFLLPGLAKGLGSIPAIALTAVLWASLHVQYQLFFIGQIIALGLLLGTLRWRTGSTLLTFILHATNNGAALLLLALDNAS
ncbi:MAG TPA: type II CAAX endopeptidase family protein [Micropepsaceae bacterium]|jgi:membrane protease YdiL (CAAX protease family)|nr:type II CAAX endopeptidase family protein [Micropepsaceae bacterium]